MTHDRADAPDDGSSELTMDRGDDKRRAPWKVEGLDEPDRRGRFRFTGSPMKRRTFWMILGVLLLVNWIVARAVLLPPPDLGVC